MEARKLTSADFTTEKVIGEGSYGRALLCKDKVDDELVVVKEVSLGNMTKEEIEAAHKETRILECLHHPYIVKYKGSFLEKNIFHIAMEYADGGDLSQKIEEAGTTLFPEEQIIDWFVQISLAVKHCHDKKILHRDLKTQNIFLMKNGTIKLGDFGIARTLQSTMELAKTAIGTPYYLSPEICQGKGYNVKSDIWSLGCILYELCTLKHPFDANNINALVMRIVRKRPAPIPSCYSPRLAELVTRMLEKLPKKRPNINEILRIDWISERIGNLLTKTTRLAEFSHTVYHGLKAGEEPKKPVAVPKPARAAVATKQGARAGSAKAAAPPAARVATPKSGTGPSAAKARVAAQNQRLAAAQRQSEKEAKEKRDQADKKQQDEYRKQLAEFEAAKKKRDEERKKELQRQKEADRAQKERMKNLKSGFDRAKINASPSKAAAAKPVDAKPADAKKATATPGSVKPVNARILEKIKMMKKDLGVEAEERIEDENENLIEFVAATQDFLENPDEASEEDDTDTEQKFFFRGAALDLPPGPIDEQLHIVRAFIEKGIGKTKFDAAYKCIMDQGESDITDEECESSLKKILNTDAEMDFIPLIQQLIAFVSMENQ